MSEPSPASGTQATPPRDGRPRLCLFGAPGDTGNLGVSALLHGTLAGLAPRIPDADLTVFDVHANGERTVTDSIGHRPFSYRVVGARLTRRVHQHESLWNLAVSTRVNLTGSPGAAALRRADAVLDISGGDSFSDLYGAKRFKVVTLPKQLALARGKALVLLPQTYGPFQHGSARERAASIVRRARMAWARDPDSYEALKELAGDGFDPARHRLGVDVAFATPSVAPPGGLPEPLATWLRDDRDQPVAGLNVSGLVYFSPDPAARFGITLDYRDLVLRLVRRLLETSTARVVLVHHLLGTGGREPDEKAQQDLLARLSPAERERVALAPSGYDVRETKWLVSRLDWFCGTRMHATIGALSTGVPAAAIAYSMKTRGVFATCDQEGYVTDARHDGVEEILDRLERAFSERAHAGERLRRALPAVFEQCGAQMDEIARVCAESAGSG